MAAHLDKASKELQSHSLEDLSIRDLLFVMHHAQERLQAELSSVRFITDEVRDSLDMPFDPLIPVTLPFPY